MTGDEKQVEEIVAELRAGFHEQLSAPRVSLLREIAMLEFVFHTRDPNQPLQWVRAFISPRPLAPLDLSSQRA
jgi:hypothetical protein